MTERTTNDDGDLDRELDRRSAVFAEGLNCLSIVLCAKSLESLRERYGPADIHQTLTRSAEICVDFVSWLIERKCESLAGVDLPASAEAFDRLRALLDDPGILEPDAVAPLRQAIRSASAAFGIELPAHLMGTNGTVCEYHGSQCPPPEPQLKVER